MEKRSPAPTARPLRCVTCGGPLAQPTTGRPRAYCSVPCRRAAEMELRRITALVLGAEKAEQRARASLATADGWQVAGFEKAAKFWAAEIEELRARLLAMLAAAGDDDDQ